MVTSWHPPAGFNKVLSSFELLDVFTTGAFVSHPAAHKLPSRSLCSIPAIPAHGTRRFWPCPGHTAPLVVLLPFGLVLNHTFGTATKGE